MKTLSKKKIALLILFIIAFIYVLVNAGKVHVRAFQREIDLTGMIVDAERTDNRMAVLAGRNLYITDPDGFVQSIVSVETDRIFSFNAYDVCIDGDFVYAFGTDIHKNTGFLSADNIARFNEKGKLEGYVFDRDYEAEDKSLYTKLKAIAAKNGYIYCLDDDNGHITLFKIPDIPEKENELNTLPEVIAEFDIPLGAVKAKIIPDAQKVYIQQLFGDVYEYDAENDVCVILPGLKEIPGDTRLLMKDAEHLTLNSSLYTRALLYYASILVLIFAFVYCIYLFFKSGAFSRNKMVWIIALFLLISVYTLSGHFTRARMEAATGRLSSVADMAIMDLEPYFEDITVDYEDFSDIAEDPDTIRRVDFCRDYINSVCERRGADMTMFMEAYAVNENMDMFSVSSSARIYYTGEKISTIADYLDQWDNPLYDYLKKHIETGSDTPGVFEYAYSFSDRLGLQYIEERYLYDKNGNLTFILEIIGDENSLRSDSINDAVSVVLQLSAMLAFCWVLIDCIGSYKDDLSGYIKSPDKKSIHVRIKLGSIFFFIVNAMMCLDFVLLVMVTAYICGDLDSAAMAVMLAIPLTTYRIGSWIGSFMASTVIGKLGEKRSGLVSSIISIISFGLMAYACIIKNIYLLALGKFLEGIFLESILYSLAEGLPFEIEDEDERVSQIRHIGDSGAGAMIIGLMAAGLLAEYAGYASIYIFGLAGSALLLFMTPLLFLAKKENVETEDEGEDAPKNAWFAFFKPKALFYLFSIVIVFAMTSGLEEYVFPLLAEAQGVSDMELSNMSILINTAAFIGIESLLPKKRYNTLNLMTGSFIACGIAICVLGLNSALVTAFVVLLVVNIAGRTINDYKVLELTKITEQYGYDAKEVHENFYAVEDGLKIFQAPVLGALCSISIAFCCTILGLVTAVIPGLYTFISKKRT